MGFSGGNTTQYQQCRMGNIIEYLFLTLVEKYGGTFSSFDTSSGYIQTHYLMLGIPL